MSRRKSLSIAAAGILTIVALVSGCTSATLEDPHKILDNATTSLKGLQSVHFKLDSGGQFLYGVEFLS